jgi:hypothetical protein
LHALSVGLQGVVETRTGVVRWRLAGDLGASLLCRLGHESKLPLMLIYPGFKILDRRRRRIATALQEGDAEVWSARR